MAPFLVKGIIFLQTIGTAVPLAESLLLKGTNLTGTVRLNRKYLPADVKKKLVKKQIALHGLATQKTCDFDIYRGIIKNDYRYQ